MKRIIFSFGIAEENKITARHPAQNSSAMN
jgi:hypothetical protein